jgi:hypothetical protein
MGQVLLKEAGTGLPVLLHLIRQRQHHHHVHRTHAWIPAQAPTQGVSSTELAGSTLLVPTLCRNRAR